MPLNFVDEKIRWRHGVRRILRQVPLFQLCTRSLEPSFGLLFGDVLRNLNVSTTGAAVIVSTQETLINFSGLFAGPLLRRFSYRKVCFVGAALVSIGYLGTTMVTSVPQIIATYSVIVGVGVGMSAAANFVALSHYWVARRGQAIGLSMAGAALGFMAFPQLVRYLLDELGFQGATLVLTGVTLHAIVGSTLLQPAEWHLVPVEKDLPTKEDDKPLLARPNLDISVIEEDELTAGETPTPESLPERKQSLFHQEILRNASIISMTTDQESPNRRLSRTILPRKMSWVSVIAQENAERARPHGVLSTRKTSMISASALDMTGSCLGLATASKDDDQSFGSKTSSTVSKVKPSCWQRVASFLDLDLLRDTQYMLVSIGLSLFMVAELHFKMVVPFFLSDLGVGKSDVAFCLSFAAVADIVVRLILPPICDRVKYRKRTLFLIAASCLGISRSVLAGQREWANVLVNLIVCGFCRGATLINYQMTVAECVPLERLPGAYGLHMVMTGIAVVSLGPLLGYVRDMTGSYALFIHAQSSMMALGLSLWVLDSVLDCVRSRNSREETPLSADAHTEDTSI